jgi:hypothetical protein
MFGVIAYPALGIFKSAKSLYRTTVERTVTSGRTAMMVEDSHGFIGIQPAQVIKQYYEVSR